MRARALIFVVLATVAAAGGYGALWPTAPARAAREVGPGEAAATSTASSAARARTTAVPVPSAVTSAQPSGTPDVWTFGPGPKSLGRGATPDGRPVAPASFFADAAGLVVLDQENGRIVRSDGTAIALPGKRADDLARADDGSLAVLDRLGSKDVTILDARGQVRGRLPLEGTGLAQASDVSRVVVSGSDVYVEQNGGGPLLRIGGIDGRPAEVRSEVPGIPARDGNTLLSAGVTSEEHGRAWVTVADRRGVHRWTRELTFPGELSAVGFLDAGGHGALWAVLLAGSNRAEYINWAVCLDVETGQVRTSTTLSVEDPPWQSFRDFAVRDDGSLVVASRSDEHVSYSAYPCSAGR